MSDDGDDIQIFAFGVPQGRQLAGPNNSRGHVGSIGTLRPYTPDLGKQLRKRLHELNPAKLEFAGKAVTDTATGDVYEIVTHFVDPIAPRESNVEAFCVRDGLVVYLRPRDAVQHVEVVELGEMSGGRVA